MQAPKNQWELWQPVLAERRFVYKAWKVRWGAGAGSPRFHPSLCPPFELCVLLHSKWEVTSTSILGGWAHKRGPAGCRGRHPSQQHPPPKIGKEVLLKFRRVTGGKEFSCISNQRHANSRSSGCPLFTYQISKEWTSIPRGGTWEVSVYDGLKVSKASSSICNQSLRTFSPLDQ